MSRIGKAQEFDLMIKLLMLGDSNVGKSSILLRYINDTFNSDILNTIGVDFKVKMYQHENKMIKLAIWDTAGQERFRTLTSSYYRGAQGIILTYDSSNRSTFVNCQMWVEDIRKNLPGNKPVIILVCNKIDIEDREVSTEDGEQFAAQEGMLYVEVSAKTNKGIAHVFEVVVEKIVSSMEHQHYENRISGVMIDDSAPPPNNCCI